MTRVGRTAAAAHNERSENELPPPRRSKSPRQRVAETGRLLRQASVELASPGGSVLSGRSLWRIGRVAVALLVVGVNLLGALAVVLIAAFVVPLPAVRHAPHVRAVNFVAAAGYVALAVAFGVAVGVTRQRQRQGWLLHERAATPAEQRQVLRAPLSLFVLQVVLWWVAAAVFGVLDGTFSAALGATVAATVALTGLSTAACAYLLTERVMRGAVARALAGDAPERLAVPGVASRAVLSWALGTGVPVTGVVAIGAVALTGGPHSPTALAVAMVALGGTALTVGLLAIGVAARATADPAEAVRQALRQVQDGDLDVRVPVYDGTQLGRLQLGFNRMVAGLVERERIRAAFGVYVDPQVAERVLRDGTRLDGELVEVTVMFVDIRDFTGFAERRPATEVVAAINRLFERIVPIVHDHGGRVDSYIGDGLLAVFGAPRRQPDHADQALATALEIERAMEGQPLQVGIGCNSGPVVAGTVGAAGRYAFSVIGDVVNTAARVEAATRRTGDTVLVAGRTKDLLSATPVALVARPSITLKGKSEPTSLYAPAHQLSADAVPWRSDGGGAPC